MAVLEHVHEGLLERLAEEVSLMANDIYGFGEDTGFPTPVRVAVFLKWATGIYEFCEREGLTVEQVARSIEEGIKYYEACKTLLNLLRMDVSTHLSPSIKDKFKRSMVWGDGGHTHGFKNFQE